jgi:hypothetical protein
MFWRADDGKNPELHLRPASTRSRRRQQRGRWLSRARFAIAPPPFYTRSCAADVRSKAINQAHENDLFCKVRRLKIEHWITPIFREIRALQKQVNSSHYRTPNCYLAAHDASRNIGPIPAINERGPLSF